MVKAYLPKARVINSTKWPRDASEEEIEAVIVDTDVSKRRSSPEIEQYLAKNRDLLFLGYPTDDKSIEVYARKPER